MTDFPMIINGQRVNASRHFDVKNPATGETVGRAPNASLQDLDQAVAAAGAAFKTWSQQPDAVRVQACQAIAAKIGECAEELAQLLGASRQRVNQELKSMEREDAIRQFLLDDSMEPTPQGTYIRYFLLAARDRPKP